MKARVWIDASMTLELNRQQIEVLEHLAGYGSGLAKAIRTHVTAGVSEEALVSLLKEIGRQVGPVVNAIHVAEKKLKTEPPAPA